MENGFWFTDDNVWIGVRDTKEWENCIAMKFKGRHRQNGTNYDHHSISDGVEGGVSSSFRVGNLLLHLASMMVVGEGLKASELAYRKTMAFVLQIR